MFEEGDEVRVIDGAFANFSGTVEEVKPEKQKVKRDGLDLRPRDAGRAGFHPGREDRLRIGDVDEEGHRIHQAAAARGKANPAPPVGPALGQHGVNIMGFCKDFNARTAPQRG